MLLPIPIAAQARYSRRITRSSDGIIALETDSFYQSIKRFARFDSRKQSLFEINSIVLECIALLNNLVNSKFLNKNYANTDEYLKCCEELFLLINQLEQACIGIDNLKFTYISDINTETQLEILIAKINTTIKEMKQKFYYLKSFLPEKHNEMIFENDIYNDEKNNNFHECE